MGKIIKFEKPSMEDEFFNSLNEQQKDMYYEILKKIQKEQIDIYTSLQEVTAMYIEKIAECEELKIKLGEL